MPDDVDELLDDLDWQANDADPAAVRAAFRLVRQARTREQSDAAYTEVLDVIAHNHSGALYPAAGPAAAVLAAIVRRYQGWPRRTALEVLVDCLCWARPEQSFIDGDGRTASVQAALHDAAESIQPGLATRAVAADPATPVVDLLRH